MLCCIKNGMTIKNKKYKTGNLSKVKKKLSPSSSAMRHTNSQSKRRKASTPLKRKKVAKYSGKIPINSRLKQKYRNSLIKKKFKTPVKSSFKKESRNLKVKWSPQVKQIEREELTGDREEKSDFYIKLNKNKTLRMSGVVYASYASRNKPIIHLNIYEKNSKILQLKLDLVKKKIMEIANAEYNISDEKSTDRIRTLFNFGNITWLHGKKKIVRSCDQRGFDLSWLQYTNEFKAYIK